MKNSIPDAAPDRMSTSTQPLDRPQVVCPPWCTDTGSGDGCKGEHSSEITAVPASGGTELQYIVDRDWHAGYIPIVSVRTVRHQWLGEPCDDAPSVSLYVCGTKRSDGNSPEAEVNLRAHETRALIERLTACLTMIENEQ